MRSLVVWTSDESGPLLSITFSPDGTKFLAVGKIGVRAHNAATGDSLRSLPAHKGDTRCLACAPDGTAFATGGGDSRVNIWTPEGEIAHTYSHREAVTCLAYDRTTSHLASASGSDLAIWSPITKSATKHKVKARVLFLAWSWSGSIFALAQEGGCISLRDSAGAELWQCSHNGTIAGIAWRPLRNKEDNELAVLSSDGFLSFHDTSGKAAGKSVSLGRPATALAYFDSGEFMCIAYADGRVMLHSREGAPIVEVAEHNSPASSLAVRTGGTHVAVACQEGHLSVHQLTFATVHGLFQDCYAFREGMTGVVVQNMATGGRAAIRCGAHVLKIAVYERRLAVQLRARVLVYGLPADAAPGDLDMHVIARVERAFDCNLLMVAAHHLILCQERELQLWTFQGELEREWSVGAPVRYVRMVGGPEGHERLLAGLKDGTVLHISIDRQEPMSQLRHSAPVRCLDMSASSKMVAVVDESSEVHVYELASGALLWSAEGATSAAWNTDFEDMLSYSGNGHLCTKTADLPIQRQKFQGFVVGFSGSKVYCLHSLAMQAFEVPLLPTLQAFLDLGHFEKAYQVACLGVTESGWQLFAEAAVQALRLDHAAAAYERMHDPRKLHAVQRLNRQISEGLSLPLARAAALSLLGKSQGDSQHVRAVEAPERTMAKFSDENLVEEARATAQPRGLNGTRLKQSAKPTQKQSSNQRSGLVQDSEHETAATALLKAGDKLGAVDLLAEHGLWDRLLQVAASLDADSAGDRSALQRAAAAFRSSDQADTALELLNKLGDYKAVAEMAVEEQRWEEALVLLRLHPDLKETVPAPRARNLLTTGCHEEAYTLYKDAGMLEEAGSVLQQLLTAAVKEGSFYDAARHALRVGLGALAQVEGVVGSTSEMSKALESFQRHYSKAQIYCGYQLIHQAATGAPHNAVPSTLFHAAHFVLTRLLQLGTAHMPAGVSMVAVLQCLASQGAALGAQNVAAAAHSQLLQYCLPGDQEEDIEVAALLSRCKECLLPEELLPVCFRCGISGDLQFMQDEQCLSCGATYIRSMLTFECLPLMEVFLEEGMSDEEAAHVLRQTPSNMPLGQKALQRDGEDTEFHPVEVIEPIIVGREALEAGRTGSQQIMVQRWPAASLQARYFRVMDPDMPMSMSAIGPVEKDELEIHMAKSSLHLSVFKNFETFFL